MNERIRQLAEQAGIPAIDGVWDYNDRNLLVKDGGEWRTAVPSEIIGTMINSEKGLEKFAELIVQECAKAIADDDLAKDCGTIMMDSYAKGMRYSAHLIKEHFGVK